MTDSMRSALDRALAFREPFFDAPHDAAFRLVNGFTEGLPDLTIDILARTAVIIDHSAAGAYRPEPLTEYLCTHLDWLKCVVLKRRETSDPAARNGVLLSGSVPDSRVCENGVRYEVDPLLNSDAGFFADTRELRRWLKANLAGKSVLNTFAYTGSLGVAAAAGGASFVLQTDRSDRFLELARRSFTLNQYYFNRRNFLAADFFPAIAKLKREDARFDCVILDPPFFAQSQNGVIDLAADPLTPINKVRPLVADGGCLVVVNNSLYLSGQDFLNKVDSLCDGRYLTREAIIPVPADYIGPDAEAALRGYSVSPAPFKHPTKIVILRVHTKTGV